MIQQTPQAEQFKHQLRDSLRHETLNSRAVKIARHANVSTYVAIKTRWSTSSRAGRSNCFCSHLKVRVPPFHPQCGRRFRRAMPVRVGRTSGNSDGDERNILKTNSV
jgi:hypothetical protein